MIIHKQTDHKKINKKRYLIPLLPSPTLKSDLLALNPKYHIYPSQQHIFKNAFKVNNLTIYNEHSSVHWPGQLNLNSISNYTLRDILDFGKDHIEIYPGTSPAIGTELNRPCIATFFKAIDIEKCKQPYCKIIKLLKKKCKKMGVNLISFDISTGEMKIGIKHFTKYSMKIEDELEQQDIDILSDSSESVQAKSQQFQDFQRSYPGRLRFFKNSKSPLQPITQTQTAVYSRLPSVTQSNKIASSFSFKNIQNPKPLELQIPKISQASSKIIINQDQIRSIERQNNKLGGYNFTPQNLVSSSMLFGGNGFRYNIQRTLLQYKLKIQKTCQTSYEQAEIITKLVRINALSPFEDGKFVSFLSTSNMPIEFKEILSLFNILFNPENNIRIQNNGYFQKDCNYDLEFSIKQWFQNKMIKQPIKTRSQIIGMLLRRQVSQLVKKFFLEGHLDIAQFASKIQDRLFTNFVSLEISLPQQLRAISDESFLNFIQNESWLSKIAANLFYGKNKQVAERINFVLERCLENDINQVNIYRLLNLYAYQASKNSLNEYKIIDSFQLVNDSIISWFFSNLLISRQRRLFNNNEKYYRFRQRQLRNLLGRMTHYPTKISIIKFDNSLSEQQRRELLVGILSQMPEEQFVGDQLDTVEGVLSKATKLLNSNQQFQALTMLCSSELTNNSIQAQKLLQHQTNLVLSDDKTKKLMFLNNFCVLFPLNPKISLFRVYLELSLGIRPVDKDILVQMMRLLTSTQKGELQESANRLILKAVLQNITYFGKLFKIGGSQQNQMYEYLLKASQNDKKSQMKIRALKLPQL